MAVGVAGVAAGGGAVAMASTGDAIKRRLTKGLAGGRDRFGGGRRGDGDHSRGHGTMRKQRGG